MKSKKNVKKYTPEELKQQLPPGAFIKYSDLTLWSAPGEGGEDLYIHAPVVTEDELLALEEAAADTNPEA